jgi:hypothetical protein
MSIENHLLRKKEIKIGIYNAQLISCYCFKVHKLMITPPPSPLKMQKYDAVIGDTTIVANRSTYVDFTLPFSESGVLMVV